MFLSILSLLWGSDGVFVYSLPVNTSLVVEQLKSVFVVFTCC